MENQNTKTLFPELSAFIRSLDENEKLISPERRNTLEHISAFISNSIRKGKTVRLVFICTRNSERSLFAQALAQAAAFWFGVDEVECYSGGIRATVASPQAVAGLRRAGFRVGIALKGKNPHYRLGFAEGELPVIAFSKAFYSPVNPTEGFVAIMACEQANEDCPYVPGAALRLALPFTDPGFSDGSSEEKQVYDRCCRQVATEMLYIFKAV